MDNQIETSTPLSNILFTLGIELGGVPTHSLRAETLFLVFADKRKETSATRVENGFDLTAVHNLGQLYFKCMLLALFADCNLACFVLCISLH